MVISHGGIVAAEHPLAAQAGAQILAAGGHAVDAAVAANAAMGVISPMMCGLGGDLFCIVYDARSDRTYGLNASGWSPQALTIEFLRQQGFSSMPTSGIHSVTVPGTVAGWDKLLQRFGTMSFARTLAPAIHLAEQGFPVAELIAGYWKSEEAKLRTNAGAAPVFLPSGTPPKIGETFRNPALAWSYRQIARRGSRAFYQGAIAERLIRFSQGLGGKMTAADLREYQAEWVEPISTQYRGWTVYEIPPNGQGIAALSMLNIMAQFDLASEGEYAPRSLHWMIEAKKLAYADMLRHVGDPGFHRIPVAGMLSTKHAAARARLIREGQAECAAPPALQFEAGPDTTYLCVVDRAGNMVSLIQSIYFSFGSGLVPDGCGFALQNRGGLFSLDPAHPNALEGRKRPLHTIIPAMMARGETRVAFGIMGGWNQSQAHAQFVSKVADFGLNIQAALDHPRFTKPTFDGCDVRIESRVDPAAIEQLERWGHQVRVLPPFAQDVGGGQAVMRDGRTGVNYGASDPRKDGAAIPEPIGSIPGSTGARRLQSPRGR